MARKQVIEIECARCGNKEYQKVEGDPQNPAGDQVDVDLVITFMGKTYQYDDLCSKCKNTCGNYVDNIVKDVRASKEKAKEKRGPRKAPSSKTRSTASGSSSARAHPTSSPASSTPGATTSGS
jgi:hypothetical protein